MPVIPVTPVVPIIPLTHTRPLSSVASSATFTLRATALSSLKMAKSGIVSQLNTVLSVCLWSLFDSEV
jgi:hypothetical protein